MYTKDKLSTTTIVLHWIVGLFMIYMLASGLVMEDLEADWLFDSHTSIGVLTFVVVVPRLIWRYMKGWPKSVGNYSKFEKISGEIVHWILLGSTFLMPLSGIMMAIGGGHGVEFFAIEIWPGVSDPANPEESLVVYPLIEQLGGKVHFLVGSNFLPIALVLHIAGALKHHVIDKDATLTRMLKN
ncbi:cytochrome b [Vibrio splendidus]|uniref:cytochrome b n=1 Tax=Vibrio splendidus TaxID=29497 RepID=UPI000C839365|nr:cytochrome b [Vibrio splendidus]PMI28464.1 RNA methyltransferase [Vibrio splendidus]PMM33793.1 RNA methyltransferase [Vibrio splendidus]PMO39213.1 RNA methyltransferase [Vibrio splendidus]PTP59992.1 RNA methyltransferase [Vibrio splendidus]